MAQQIEELVSVVLGEDRQYITERAGVVISCPSRLLVIVAPCCQQSSRVEQWIQTPAEQKPVSAQGGGLFAALPGSTTAPFWPKVSYACPAQGLDNSGVI